MDMTDDAAHERQQALIELLEDRLVTDTDKARADYLAGQIEMLYQDYWGHSCGEQDCPRTYDAGGDLIPWRPEPERTFRNWSKSCPSWLKSAMHRMTWWWRINWDDDNRDSDGTPGLEAMEPEEVRAMMDADGRVRSPSIYQAEVFGSRIEEEMRDDDGEVTLQAQHVFMLDIDHRVVLVPSSTDMHFHLYIDHVMSWPEWKEALEVLGRIGLISENYAAISIARGETMLRAPWVRKGHEKEDRMAAQESWLNGAVRERTPTFWEPVPW